ncbi:hypothetical protein DESC_820034 [Desulfosarcina cetonica]|nr:hypothetical protein DESC_820034 [Desulfosarcina cetonica]
MPCNTHPTQFYSKINEIHLLTGSEISESSKPTNKLTPLGPNLKIDPWNPGPHICKRLQFGSAPPLDRMDGWWGTNLSPTTLLDLSA